MILSKIIEIPIDEWGNTPTEQYAIVSKIAADLVDGIDGDAESFDDNELIDFVCKRGLQYCIHGFCNVNHLVVFWALGKPFESGTRCVELWALCVIKDKGDKR